MACLLVLVVAAAVLTGPPGKLTHASPTSPAEAFWRAALPGAPMPDAIRELLRPGAAGAIDARPKYRDADPPPLSFSYDARPKYRDADPPPLSFSYDADPPQFGYDYEARAKHHDADPPPLSFSYDARPKHHHDGDSSSLRNNEAAVPSAEVLNRAAAGSRTRNAAAASPTVVFFLEDAVRVGGVLPVRVMTPRDTADAASQPPLRLYTVRAVRAVDGCRFVVCRRDRDAGAGQDSGNNNDERDHAVYRCRATMGPARAYVVGMVGDRGETATAAVVCRTGSGGDTSRWSNNRARAAFWLLDVKPGPGGGASAAVCHAAVGAQVIPVKKDSSCSSLA